MDARFNVATWSSFMIDQTFNAIRDIVLLSKNRAVAWNDFFTCSQNPGENINAFFTRSAQVASDADF